MTGTFIALEGPDGAGKTTQARLLAEWLETIGLATVLTREPGGTPAGAAIRQILLDPATGDLDPIAEAFLFAADKAQHVRDVIRPALAEGSVVITDRYIDSSVAYQGFGRGLGAPFIRSISEKATGGLRPDATIVLDVPVAASYERAVKNGQPDRIEAAGPEFHERVRQGLLTCAQADPARYVVIDGSRSIERVQDDLQRALAPLFL